MALSIMIGPDWLSYFEIISKSMLYIGVGFGILTLSVFKWMDFLWNR